MFASYTCRVSVAARLVLCCLPVTAPLITCDALGAQRCRERARGFAQIPVRDFEEWPCWARAILGSACGERAFGFVEKGRMGHIPARSLKNPDKCHAKKIVRFLRRHDNIYRCWKPRYSLISPTGIGGLFSPLRFERSFCRRLRHSVPRNAFVPAERSERSERSERY